MFYVKSRWLLLKWGLLAAVLLPLGTAMLTRFALSAFRVPDKPGRVDVRQHQFPPLDSTDKEVLAHFGGEPPTRVGRQILLNSYREQWVYEKRGPLRLLFEGKRGKHPRLRECRRQGPVR